MERYTEKAKEALILAAEAAEETGSRTVGTEHILVGLMKEGTGTAARVLEAGDVKLEAGPGAGEEAGVLQPAHPDP